MHDRQSQVTPPRRSLLGSIKDNHFSPPPSDSDEADAEEEEVDDDDEEVDDDDDDESGADKEHDTAEDAQLSVDEGLSHNILLFCISI